MLFPRQLAQPGSSSYSSDTLHVGDGTWDSSRDTFLLPNLQTLNYATMQYNGMGNRFRALPEYHALIRGHGVLAAITFLGVVPAAVMIARFYRPNPRLAMRMHIYLQIITLFLVTVIFILGWFAVGPERSLTNPHHDIGLTIYVLVWFQILWGWLVYKREKGKVRYTAPIRLMLHQWVGRATALLALAQIGSGLYLYGSPKVLFILYGLALGLLILLYFALSYRNQPVYGMDDGSYYTGTDVTPPRREKSKHTGLKAAVGALGGAAAIEAFRKHRRSRDEERRTDVVSSRPGSRHGSRSRHDSRHRRSDSYSDDEKFSEEPTGQHKWRNRILGGAAAGGTIAAVRHWMTKGRNQDEESYVSSYTRPAGGHTSVTQDDVSRVNAGMAPESPARLQRPRPGGALTYPGQTPNRPGYRRAGDSISSYTSVNHAGDNTFSSESESPEHRSHGLRDGIAALGVAGFAKHLWNRRRQNREDQRVDDVRRQDRMNEEIARRNSRRRQGAQFTGDGSPSFRRPGLNRPTAGGSIVTLEDSAITGSNPALSRTHLARPGGVPGPGQSSLAQGTMSSITPTYPPPSNIPLPPPPAGAPAMPMPPPPPIHDPTYVDSGSDGYDSPGVQQRRRHRLGDAAAGGAAGAAAGAAAEHMHHRNDGVESPPVSVKVKMHNDGRHVTLRRLNEQEAAAEREARRRDRRRRNESFSSLDGDDRWRRTEQHEAAQAAQMGTPGMPSVQQQHNMPPYGAATVMPVPADHLPGPPPGRPPAQMSPAYAQAQAQAMDLPPPPPIQGSGLGAASPPSTVQHGTETDISNYESNRRRRRAERMKAKATQGSGSGRVEFE